MATTEHPELWLCTECALAVNDDFTGLDAYLSPREAHMRAQVIREAFARLGPGLTPACFDNRSRKRGLVSGNTCHSPHCVI